MTISDNERELASVGQDGFAIVWSATNGYGKVDVILLYYPFALTVAMSPTSRLLATGNLDNSICVYQIERSDGRPTEDRNRGGGRRKRQTPSFTPRLPYSMLKGHRAYVSSVEFLTEEWLVSASADMSVCLWDVPTSRPRIKYYEHLGAVNCIAHSRSNPHMFASASTDCHVKVWDVRSRQSVHTFRGHEADVGALTFFPDGNVVASASDDGTLCLSDMRADGPIEMQQLNGDAGPISAMCFSPSGRLLNVGYEGGNVGVLDILKCQWVSSLQGHSESITGVCVGNSSVYTASWDGSIRVWKPVK
jgi:WD40 repeat protein